MPSERLRVVADGQTRGGWREPTWFHFWPDLIEAEIGAGQLDAAADHLAAVNERVRATQRPLGLATAARCQGLWQAPAAT